MEQVNVVIADDHQLFIAGLKTILQDVAGYNINLIDIANNGDELMNILKRHIPDLLILDLNMPERDGLDVLSVIGHKYDDLKILALTMYDEAKIVKSAFKSGVDGYVLKSSGKEELVRAISEVLEGHTFMGEGVSLNSFANGGRKSDNHVQFEDRFIKKYNLTKREIEILRLISHALSNKEIAKELYISDQTVSVHRKNIMRKLGVSNTAGLIKLAYDHSLI
ncbi:MAG: DNA-binding NarL/FixJ family response regulator [Saprospiraceae bacterium]|jgi:DNA-binding NarL/FixJ family response regulator